jgi:ATP-binding cassette, subfamily B, bacterial MsbA
MAKRPRFQLDPRIKSELVAQRRPITKGLVCAGLASALYGVTIGYTNSVLKIIESIKVTRDGDAFGALLLACAVLAFVFCVRYFFVRFQTYYLSEAVMRLTTDLRRRLLSKLLRLPISYFSDKRSGAVQSVLTNDVNVFQNAVQILRDSIEAPVKAVTALVTIIIIQWQMAIITLLMIPILGVIVHQNSKRMRKAQTEVQVTLAEVGAVTQETLQGVRVIKAFGAESYIDTEYRKLTHQSLRSQLVTAKLISKLRPLVELMGALGLIVALIISGRLAMTGNLGVSDIATLAMALDAINQGFKGFSGLSSTYSSVQAAADRIYGEILDVPEPPELSGRQTLPKVSGLIEFRNVSFAYPDGTTALSNVNFTVHPGTSVALVGPSGAGKSTIADLMLRFYEPTSGNIFLDGVDIRNLDVLWLRHQIGVVPQQIFLFAGGIDDNVKLGAPEATREEIDNALEMAHALEFSQEFRERNMPVLGERGVRLSGGQMQRIAIARALVRQPAILLLDEATSALDAASETAVTEALQEVMETRSTLFIAHRLTTAARATNILLLKRGQVIEQGSHRELLEKNGEYAALFRLFSSGVINDDLG